MGICGYVCVPCVHAMQVWLQKAGKRKGTYVVTGLRKNYRSKSEFRLSCLHRDDWWVCLKRAADKAGQEFRPLRQVYTASASPLLPHLPRPVPALDHSAPHPTQAPAPAPAPQPAPKSESTSEFGGTCQSALVAAAHGRTELSPCLTPKVDASGTTSASAATPGSHQDSKEPVKEPASAAPLAAAGATGATCTADGRGASVEITSRQLFTDDPKDPATSSSQRSSNYAFSSYHSYALRMKGNEPRLESEIMRISAGSDGDTHRAEGGGDSAVTVTGFVPPSIVSTGAASGIKSAGAIVPSITAPTRVSSIQPICAPSAGDMPYAYPTGAAVIDPHSTATVPRQTPGPPIINAKNDDTRSSGTQISRTSWWGWGKSSTTNSALAVSSSFGSATPAAALSTAPPTAVSSVGSASLTEKKPTVVPISMGAKSRELFRDVSRGEGVTGLDADSPTLSSTPSTAASNSTGSMPPPIPPLLLPSSSLSSSLSYGRAGISGTERASPDTSRLDASRSNGINNWQSLSHAQNQSYQQNQQYQRHSPVSDLSNNDGMSSTATATAASGPGPDTARSVGSGTCTGTSTGAGSSTGAIGLAAPVKSSLSASTSSTGKRESSRGNVKFADVAAVSHPYDSGYDGNRRAGADFRHGSLPLTTVREYSPHLPVNLANSSHGNSADGFVRVAPAPAPPGQGKANCTSEPQIGYDDGKLQSDTGTKVPAVSKSNTESGGGRKRPSLASLARLSMRFSNKGTGAIPSGGGTSNNEQSMTSGKPTAQQDKRKGLTRSTSTSVGTAAAGGGGIGGGQQGGRVAAAARGARNRSAGLGRTRLVKDDSKRAPIQPHRVYM